ncbi:MAG: glycosyltransferase family 4 protein [Clostridiales bacterium]|jgi:1,2-diacylglycerol 3-alpha-glucosyltransferase|nr:glycosyltransferase family 4 protein [Clostridiales bacterium]
MRIVMFTEAYLPHIGSVISHVSFLAEQLSAMGHQVLVAFSDLKAREFHLDGDLLRCPAKPARNVYGFCIDNPGSTEFFRILEKFKPDLIHIHTTSPIGQAAIKFANRYDLPMVFTIHEYYEHQLHYLCSKISEPITKIKQRGLFKDSVDNADVITAPSKQAEEYLKSCGIKRSLTVVPNHVDPLFFHRLNVSESKLSQLRRSLNLPLDSTVAIFAGRLTIDKSVEMLLEQWASQIKSTDRLHLLVVGDGPEAEPLSVWAHDLGINGQVSFLGAVPHEKMPEYYAVSDVFVSASSHDLMSNAALEAVSCGLPTLLLHDKWDASQLKEGVSGFSYRTAQEFGNYLKRFASLDADGKRILRRVVRSSIQTIPANAQAVQMLDVYAEAARLHFYSPEDDV